MKKVLYLLQTPPPFHGVTMCNKNIIESEYIRKNCKVHLIKVNYNSSLSTVNTFTYKKVFKFAQVFISLLKELVVYRPKVVYYSIPPTGKGLYKDIPYVILFKVFGVKPVFHLHGKGIHDYVQKSKWHLRLHRWIYSNTNIIHLSKGLLEKEILPLKLKRSNYFIVPNGIIDSKYNKTDISYNKETIQLVFLSNLLISKGILLVFEILRLIVSDTNHNVKLNIIGDFKNPETQKKVEEFIVSNRLQKFCVFHGAQYDDDKFRLLSKMDILIYPSFNDAFPLVILEALQCGVPVVASDQGAIPEILNKQTGEIFKTGDLLMAYQKTLDLINRYLSHRDEITKNCKTHYKSNFTLIQFEKNLMQVFDAI